MKKIIYILLFGHLIYVADNYTRDVVHRYNLNQDIKNNIVPILKQKKINYNTLSDITELHRNTIRKYLKENPELEEMFDAIKKNSATKKQIADKMYNDLRKAS